MAKTLTERNANDRLDSTSSPHAARDFGRYPGRVFYYAHYRPYRWSKPLSPGEESLGFRVRRISTPGPSYDVEKLVSALVYRTPGRSLEETRFYTGVPDPASGTSQRY